jgi:adenylate kinase family enzyme
MNVILEGPDNAGKTTLAEHLKSNVTGFTYYHPGGKPDDWAAEEAFMQIQHDLAATRDRHVLDRVTCISQQVYNPDDDPDDGRDPIRSAHALLLTQLRNVVVIYCRPPNEVLMDVGNFKWRPEESEEHRQKIISRQHEFVERYDRVMLSVPAIFYNWKDEAHATVIKTKLVQALNGDLGAQAWFQQLIHYRSTR